MNDAFLANKRANIVARTPRTRSRLSISKGKTVQNVTREREMSAPPRGNEITILFLLTSLGSRENKISQSNLAHVNMCLPLVSSSLPLCLLKIGATFRAVRSFFCDGQITIGLSVIVYLCEPSPALRQTHHIMLAVCVRRGSRDHSTETRRRQRNLMDTENLGCIIRVY